MRLIPNDLYSLRHIGQRPCAQQSTSGKKKRGEDERGECLETVRSILIYASDELVRGTGSGLSPYNHPADDQVRKGGAPEKRPVPLFSGRAGRL